MKTNDHGYTLQDMQLFIGQDGWFHTEGLIIGVKIKNVRACFGRVDLYITPINGQGATWVQSSRVAFNDPTNNKGE